jgi:2-polyprenyl-3-methyl-5-hydroxy-6-metoxy-1,4-benzoquinol methylase
MALPDTGRSGTNAERHCPACGGDSFTDRSVADELRTHTCRSCGLILGSTFRRKPKVGQYANVDLRAYLSSVGALRHVQSSEILSFLRPHVRPGARILDVGCGFGSFLIRARDAGFAVAGIEPDRDACVQACKVLGEGVVKQGTLQQTPPSEESADLVVTLDVLEHVLPRDHAAFAGTVAATLAPGGMWAIKVPSTEGLYYRLSARLAAIAPRLGAPFMRRLWQVDYEFPHGFTLVDVRYLPEVPLRTIIDRLTHDGDISRARAYLLAPAVGVINVIEWVRGRSDALVVLARRNEAEPAAARDDYALRRRMS